MTPEAIAELLIVGFIAGWRVAGLSADGKKTLLRKPFVPLEQPELLQPVLGLVHGRVAA